MSQFGEIEVVIFCLGKTINFLCAKQISQRDLQLPTLYNLQVSLFDFACTSEANTFSLIRKWNSIISRSFFTDNSKLILNATKKQRNHFVYNLSFNSFVVVFTYFSGVLDCKGTLFVGATLTCHSELASARDHSVQKTPIGCTYWYEHAASLIFAYNTL